MKNLMIIFFSVLFFHSTASGVEKQYSVYGETMGTFYNIKFISDNRTSKSVWKKKIETCLKNVNGRLSVSYPNSEISLFNGLKKSKLFRTSPDFHSILLTSRKLYRLTDGAWDCTVMPLIKIWGFGTEKRKNIIPEKEKIFSTLSLVGFDNINIVDRGVIKKKSEVNISLGSIAKGYGVDRIASLFRNSGIENFLVEIGGDLYVAGNNIKNSPWSVGITTPDKEYAKQDLYKILSLRDTAIATSGNYRDFYKVNGITYSHIFNPKTGLPSQNQVVSASVIADSCTFADGLATALMVMDVKKGVGLINGLENIECLIIQRIDDKFVETPSRSFMKFLKSL